MDRKKVTEAFCVMIISLQFVYILTINLFVYLHFDKSLFNHDSNSQMCFIIRIELRISNQITFYYSFATIPEIQ